MEATRAELARLSHAWTALDVVDAAMRDRFATATARVEQALVNRERDVREAEERARQRAEAIATRDALCARVETLDGDDVLGLDREQLRQRFAVVPQDVVLFPGTVATNIAASETPDRARVSEVLRRIDALDLAHALGFSHGIGRLPMKASIPSSVCRASIFRVMTSDV